MQKTVTAVNELQIQGQSRTSSFLFRFSAASSLDQNSKLPGKCTLNNALVFRAVAPAVKSSSTRGSSFRIDFVLKKEVFENDDFLTPFEMDSFANQDNSAFDGCSFTESWLKSSKKYFPALYDKLFLFELTRYYKALGLLLAAADCLCARRRLFSTSKASKQVVAELSRLPPRLFLTLTSWCCCWRNWEHNYHQHNTVADSTKKLRLVNGILAGIVKLLLKPWDFNKQEGF